MDKYSVVDLFAGAGGLSLGFAQTQKYDIKVAFENNPSMQETYRANHKGVEVQGDVTKADYATIVKKYGPIDVVIGGPPCQGFSNANRQKNQAISRNNMLVKQYIRAIVELQPKGFIMENVSMLKSDVHRFYLEDGDVNIVKKYDIPMKNTPLELLPSNLVFKSAKKLVTNEDQIRRYLWPEEQYTEFNVIYKATKNEKKLPSVLEKHRAKIIKFEVQAKRGGKIKPIADATIKAIEGMRSYYAGKLGAGKIKTLIEPAIMYQRMLNKALEIIQNHIVVDDFDDTNGLIANIRSFAVYDYLRKILSSEDYGYAISSNVLCAADYGAPQKRMRFVVIGVKKTISKKVALPKGGFDEDEYRTVRDAIEDISDITPVTGLEEDKGVKLKPKATGELASQLRNSPLLYNHIVTKTTKTAMERFMAIKQGQNFHSLADELKTNTYTDASRTQNTIYLRLNYDEPSGTVVNVRKSMWIHPELNRAISVREAARLQTFPDSFVFFGSKDKQYQQVGNAVPPIMAKAIAKKLAKLLSGK